MNQAELQDRVYDVLEDLVNGGARKWTAKEKKKQKKLMGLVWASKRRRGYKCIKKHKKQYPAPKNYFADGYAGADSFGPQGFLRDGGHYSCDNFGGHCDNGNCLWLGGKKRKKRKKNGAYKRGAKKNPWIQFFKEYQKKSGLSGKEAMEQASIAYREMTGR